MKLKRTGGAVLAIAAAGLFGCAPQATTAPQSAQVECWGVNQCKGHNDCKTAQNACKGHGSCKGQGFVRMSRHACDEIGGTVKTAAHGGY
jgi:hypothetical protein